MAVLISVLFLATYCREPSHILCFTSKKIDYYINREMGNVSADYVHKIFLNFNNATKYQFRFAGKNDAGLKHDGKNAISFVNSWPENIPLTNIGYTERWYDSAGIAEADIILNQQSVGFTVLERHQPGRYYLETVLSHEIGHMLGLEHSADPKSIMYHHKTPDETKWPGKLDPAVISDLNNRCPN